VNASNHCVFSRVPVELYAIEWSTGRRPWIMEEKGLEKSWIFRELWRRNPGNRAGND